MPRLTPAATATATIAGRPAWAAHTEGRNLSYSVTQDVAVAMIYSGSASANWQATRMARWAWDTWQIASAPDYNWQLSGGVVGHADEGITFSQPLGDTRM